MPASPLASKFESVKLLGEGGMGEVWRVRRRGFTRDRAVKLIHSKWALSGAIRSRLEREAEAMDRISHPHAVIVHDVGMDPAPYIEMEYIPGKTLDKLLRPGVPMVLDWTMRILEQLCDVLQAAHEKEKIVHRDLKPSNLMLVDGYPEGQEYLKVLDFGIAKLLEDAETNLTSVGELLGTVKYMSPEQSLDSANVDHRSDIFTVGVILYELLTGYHPIQASGRNAQMIEIVHNPPPPFNKRNPSVPPYPPGVEELVLSCLDKDPAQRPQSAAKLAEEFRRRTLFKPPPPAALPPAVAARRANAAGAAGGSSRLHRPESRSPATHTDFDHAAGRLLPANWKPVKQFSPVTLDNKRYYQAIERILGPNLRVVAVLIHGENLRGAPPFYIMKDKVCVALFERFARKAGTSRNAPPMDQGRSITPRRTSDGGRGKGFRRVAGRQRARQASHKGAVELGQELQDGRHRRFARLPKHGFKKI